MTLRHCLTLSLLSAAVISMAAVDAYTIKRTPKVGEVHKYKQVGKFDVGGQEFEYEATASQKVAKVEDSGNYTVEEAQSDVKLNGQEAPEGSGPGATNTTFSAKGEVLEIKGDRVEANTYRFANLAIFILPEKEVAFGDSWSYDIKEDKKLGSVAGKATYKLVGEEKIGSNDCLKLSYSVKESGSDAASSEGTVWIRKGDSTLIKMSAKWTNAPVPGAPMSITGDITLTLIS